MDKKSHHRTIFAFICVALLACFHGVQGYPSGAPATSHICETMLPSHQVPAQTSDSPYSAQISATKDINGGDTVKITLGSSSGESFKGFLVMVKKAGDPKKALGKFKPGPSVQAIDCFGVVASAATHNSADERSTVEIEWIAPHEDDFSDLELLVTYVKNGAEFWQAIPHPEKLTVKKNLSIRSQADAQPQQIGDELRNRLKEQYECAQSGCMGFPDGCIQSFLETQDQPNPTVCQMMLTWRAEGERNVFTMSHPGSSGRYVAMGFSNDDKMGQDSIAACISDGDNSGVHRYHSTGQSTPGFQPQDGTNPNIRAASVNVIDNHMFCSFEQTDHQYGEVDVKLRDNSYYILLATGTGSGQDIFYHNLKTSSEGRISVLDIGRFGSSDSSRLLIQLHGAFMICAWLLCASTGMFTARYFKASLTHLMPFSKAVWFVIHVVCMFSTAFLTACGAIFIIIKKSGFQFKQGDDLMWHPLLGVILFGLAIFQVLIALFRPHPGTKTRPIFNWVHWLVGNSAHIIGIACIFLANDLSAANLDEDVYLYITLGAVIFHIVMHLFMSFHTYWADTQMNEKTKRAVVPGPMKISSVPGEAPGTGFRMTLLTFYIIGLGGCAIALIYYVCRPLDIMTS